MLNPSLSTNQKKELIQVRIQRFIPAPPWKVLRLLSKVEKFPQYAPSVREVRVLERGDHFAITQWFIDIEGLPIQWKEKDVFDLSHLKISFQLLDGDLEKFQGEWTLQKVPAGTEVTIDVSALLGIPILERVVTDLLQEKLTRNFQSILDGMENRFISDRYGRVGEKSPSQPSGFVVMGHPYNFNNLVRYFKFFKKDTRQISQEFLVKLFELTPSYHSYDISNYKSPTGKITHGYFVLCPIIPDMIDASPERVIRKVLEGCRIGERMGAGIVTLGGFTSIVGERYQDKVKGLIKIPVTTGNAFTAAMAIEGVKKAAELMGIEIGKSRLTIIGGGGDIGSACARVLADEVKELVITGRRKETLKEMKKKIEKLGKAKVITSVNNDEAVSKADIVIAAASSSQSLVDIKSFKAGCVICDVGYPKNTSYMTAYRNDLFAFSGGLCTVPMPFDLGFDIGLPSTEVLYGCFAEAIILSFEERYENFSQGKGNIGPEKISEIRAMGARHGFRLAPFYWGDRLMTEDDIVAIRKNIRGS